MLEKLRKNIMRLKDVPAAFKQEFRKLRQSTTITEILRTFMSKKFLVRILWLLAALTIFGILSWQLFMTITYYFNWPVKVIYREDYNRPVFPDITICNINPFAYERKELSWSDYLRFTSRKKQILAQKMTDPKMDLTSDADETEWSFIQSATGYFSNFPAIRPNSETSNELIREYNYFGWDFQWNRVTEGVLNFVWNSEFSACYTIQTKVEGINSVRALDLLLYLNNFVEYAHRSKGFHIADFPSTGVKVFVHPPGTKPLFHTGMNIGPGTATIMHLSSTLRRRLPKPYGNCETEKNLKEPDISGIITPEVYSKDGCYHICLQQQAINQCGCIYHNFQFTEHQLQSVNGTICGNQSLKSDSRDDDDHISDMTSFKQLRCAYNARFDFDSCEMKCLHPCKEYQYEATLSSAPWPHLSTHLSFYQKYISRESDNWIELYGDKFHVYDELLNSDLNQSQKISKLREIYLIKDNFIKLDILFEEDNPMVLEEIPATPWYELMTLIRGCLSLWLDVTMLHFVEVIEFFLAISLAVLTKRTVTPLRASEAPDDEETPPLLVTM